MHRLTNRKIHHYIQKSGDDFEVFEVHKELLLLYYDLLSIE